MGRSEYIIETEEPSSWLNTKERIVRCKDCKHLTDGVCDRFGDYPSASGVWFEVEPDGFCAWGEN